MNEGATMMLCCCVYTSAAEVAEAAATLLETVFASSAGRSAPGRKTKKDAAGDDTTDINGTGTSAKTSRTRTTVDMHVLPSLLFRWYCFRFMLGAGLVKHYGSPMWRDGTAMLHHYYNQPYPNGLSWWFHHQPEWLHRLSVQMQQVDRRMLESVERRRTAAARAQAHQRRGGRSRTRTSGLLALQPRVTVSEPS